MDPGFAPIPVARHRFAVHGGVRVDVALLVVLVDRRGYLLGSRYVDLGAQP